MSDRNTDPSPKPGTNLFGDMGEALTTGYARVAAILYWLTTIVAAAIAALGPAALMWRRQPDETWGLLVIASVAILLVAVIIYLLGWSFRWLFCDRSDHLFSAPRRASVRSRHFRAKYSRAFAFISFFTP